MATSPKTRFPASARETVTSTPFSVARVPFSKDRIMQYFKFLRDPSRIEDNKKTQPVNHASKFDVLPQFWSYTFELPLNAEELVTIFRGTAQAVRRMQNRTPILTMLSSKNGLAAWCGRALPEMDHFTNETVVNIGSGLAYLKQQNVTHPSLDAQTTHAEFKTRIIDRLRQALKDPRTTPNLEAQVLRVMTSLETDGESGSISRSEVSIASTGSRSLKAAP